MASATGIPDRGVTDEQEPLLGRPGDASQRDEPIYNNLVIGRRLPVLEDNRLAQKLTEVNRNRSCSSGRHLDPRRSSVGGSILASVDIVLCASSKCLTTGYTAYLLSSYHFMSISTSSPLTSNLQLLNSAGVLLIAQGALILQPTHTASQKRVGTYIHAAFNDLGVSALIAGLIVIEVNKYKNGLPHLESPHAILGIITYVLLILQALVGFTQYFVPQLYGGEDNAKKVWKYHRASGYVVFTLALATVAAATQTSYNKNVLDIKLWAVLVASVITLAGILPRIKKQKLGFN